jgi:hypothetical protein
MVVVTHSSRQKFPGQYTPYETCNLKRELAGHQFETSGT